MPFQVSFSVYRRQLPTVVLVTAGPDQYRPCDTYVYLEATVSGDITGHAIEWEQIEGTMVILQDGNTLTPWYAQIPGDVTGVVFRLYIDRGTPDEQFDDVLIRRWPISEGVASYISDVGDLQNIPIPVLPVPCSSIVGYFTIAAPPPSTYEGEEPNPSTYSVPFVWDHPGGFYDSYIIQYTVKENGTPVYSVPPTPLDGGTAMGGNGPPSGTKAYTGTLAKYVITTDYIVGGFDYTVDSCEVDYTAFDVPEMVVVNDSVFASFVGQENNGNINSLSRFSYLYVTAASEGVASFTGITNINSFTRFNNTTEQAYSEGVASFTGISNINSFARQTQTGVG